MTTDTPDDGRIDDSTDAPPTDGRDDRPADSDSDADCSRTGGVTDDSDRTATADGTATADRDRSETTDSDRAATGGVSDDRDRAATINRAATTDVTDDPDRDGTADHDSSHSTTIDDTDDRDRDSTADGSATTVVTDDRNRNRNRTANANSSATGDVTDDRNRNRHRTANADRSATGDVTDDRNRNRNRTANANSSATGDVTDDSDRDGTADSDRHRPAVADGGDREADADGSDGEGADATVTPYAVSGAVDYDDLLQRFGADPLTDEQVARFPTPQHPMLRRGVYYAGRDVDRFLSAAERGDTVSIVTGVGPSGPMHLGHVTPFYLAKYLQERTGAYVYVPLSDDEKYLLKPDLSMADVHRYTRENLRDLLAVGLDPDRTRFVVDTLDADVVYPNAVRFAKHVTQSTMEATYGEPPNVGASFYPAVQATHLLLPQLVHGRHPTLVPVAVDQDPHVRVCRDVAGRAEYDVDKPGALLGQFLPTLAGPGKMSSSDDGSGPGDTSTAGDASTGGDSAAAGDAAAGDPSASDGAPPIYLTDDRETVAEKIRTYAYSGGRTSVAEHREHGGDPEVDVAFQYLRFFFEPDDEVLADIEERYRSGELLSGELKEHAIERIADFLADHQRRRPEGDIAEAVEPFRLTDEERATLRPDVLG